MLLNNWLQSARLHLIEAVQVYWHLLKIMIPALVIVKLLQTYGAIDWLGAQLAPAMSLVGLPALLGVVWATTLLTNIFAGLLIFSELSSNMALTIEQVTVLGTLMVIGHSIPIEGAVARRAGVPWSVTIVLRVGGALLLGTILHHTYSGLGIYQMPANISIRSEVLDDSLGSWLYAQFTALGLIFLVILALIIFLKVLKVIGLEKVIHILLIPILRVLGIGHAAANITVIGVALGLSYGAGLLIRDLDKGIMSRRDGYLALCLLGLLHSLIEDTLLIMAMGAELSGILWARLLFSITIMAILARFVTRRDDQETTATQH